VSFEYVSQNDAGTDSGGADNGPDNRRWRDFVLVLDDTSISASLTKATIDLSKRLIDELGPLDRLAIINTSRFDVVQDLATDRAAARAVVERIRGQLGPEPVSANYRSRVLLKIVRNVARGLAAETRPNRRTVLILTEGRALGATVVPGIAGDEDYHATLDAYREMLAAAAAADVAIYSVDVRGLEVRQPTIGGPTSQSVADLASVVGSTYVAATAISRRGLLWQVSDSTGGTLVVERNRLDVDLKAMIRDSRQHYRLAYAQPASVQPGSPMRTIDVRVKGKGLTVRARRHYVPG